MNPMETKPQKWRRAGHLIGTYLSLLRDEERLRDRTIARYRNALNKFACYCEVNCEHREQTIDEVLLSTGKPFAKSFKNSLVKQKLRKRSAEPIISALRHFYSWLAQTNQIKQNPFGKPHAKRTKEFCLLRVKPKAKRPIAITLEQVKLKRKEPETGISIMAAVEKWLAYNLRFAKDTQRHYHDVVLWFVDSLPNDINAIDQLTSAHLRDFLTSLLSKGLKNRSVNSHLTALQSFARWLSEQYDMPNVADKVRSLKAEPPQSRFLSREEYQKVLAVCHGRDKEIVELLGNTGLRASELSNLKWGNISQDYKMINLTGKGRKFRHIPCNAVVQSILHKYPRQADTKKLQLLEIRKINKDSLYQLGRKLSKRAGIEKFGAHAVRHYFATELLKREVPIYYVSKLLGHSSVVLTERLYAHFQPEFLNGMTDCLTGGAE